MPVRSPIATSEYRKKHTIDVQHSLSNLLDPYYFRPERGNLEPLNPDRRGDRAITLASFWSTRRAARTSNQSWAGQLIARIKRQRSSRLRSDTWFLAADLGPQIVYKMGQLER